MLEIVHHSGSDIHGLFPSLPPSHEEIVLLFDGNSSPIIVKRDWLEALKRNEKRRIIGARLDTLKLVAIRSQNLTNYVSLRDYTGAIEGDKLVNIVRIFLRERVKFCAPMFGVFTAHPHWGYGDEKKTYEIYDTLVHSKIGAAAQTLKYSGIKIEFDNVGEELYVNFDSAIGHFISLEDEDLIFSWRGKRNARSSPSIISRRDMKINPESLELRRLVQARLAEKFALSMYSFVSSLPVEDVSIGQLAKNDDRWLSFDIWADRPIDVKNVTIFRQNTRQNFIPKFKRHAGREVVIAAFATLVGNRGSTRQTFLGEVTECDLELSREAVAREFPVIDSLKVRFDDQYIPAWAFDYEFAKIDYCELLEAYLLFAHTPESILAAAIAAGKEDTVSAYSKLKPRQLSVVDSFSRACKGSSYSKRTIILFAISGFISECLSNGDPEWFVGFFRKLFQMERLSGASAGALCCPDFSESSIGGLVDPLKSAKTLFDLLEISARSIKNSGLVFDAFHTPNPHILLGRLRDGKKVTIYAYCGGRINSGAPCDTFPLVIGQNLNCRACGKLICHECGFCSENCSGTNVAEE